MRPTRVPPSRTTGPKKRGTNAGTRAVHPTHSAIVSVHLTLAVHLSPEVAHTTAHHAVGVRLPRLVTTRLLEVPLTGVKRGQQRKDAARPRLPPPRPLGSRPSALLVTSRQSSAVKGRLGRPALGSCSPSCSVLLRLLQLVWSDPPTGGAARALRRRVAPIPDLYRQQQCDTKQSWRLHRRHNRCLGRGLAPKPSFKESVDLSRFGYWY